MFGCRKLSAGVVVVDGQSKCLYRVFPAQSVYIFDLVVFIRDYAILTLNTARERVVVCLTVIYTRPRDVEQTSFYSKGCFFLKPLRAFLINYAPVGFSKRK